MTTKPLPIHPYCDLFPDIEGEEFGAFVQSIKANGLHVPIDEYRSQVIDGKNRQRACLLADVTPIYKIWSPPNGTPKEGIDAALLTFVKSRNLDRRHFTPGQRASMASKLATCRQGNQVKPLPSTTNKPANLPIGVHPTTNETQAEAAKEFGVSQRSVRAAKHVQEHAKPEVVTAVEQGKMTLNAAEATIPKKPSKPPIKRDNGKDGYFDTSQQTEWRNSYGKLVRMSSEWMKLAGGNTNTEARKTHAEYEDCLSKLIKLWIAANPTGRWF
jgi:hypothetical protein